MMEMILKIHMMMVIMFMISNDECKGVPLMVMWMMMSMTYTPTMQRQVHNAQVNTLGPVLVLETSSVSTLLHYTELHYTALQSTALH